ncbi:MAG: DNA primase [Pseudomonadota bacterium]
MVRFPESKIREIRSIANIVEVIGDYISLKRVGRDYQGLCPFHPDKTPSFKVSEEKNVFHCFGCGAGGDVFSFLTAYHKISFDQAVRDLAQKYHVVLPENKSVQSSTKSERLYDLNEKISAYYARNLKDHEEAKSARAYLAKRGLSLEDAACFELGFALDGWDNLCRYLERNGVPLALAEEAGLIVPKKSGGFYDRFRDRITFPIRCTTGRIAGFGGRVLDDSLPKYLNSPETAVYHKSDSLYGLHLAKNDLRKSGCGLIVEGYFDFISLYHNGLKNVVATCGTALTPSHVRFLKGYVEEIVVVFDSDQAGIKAALRSTPIFLKEEVAAKVLVLPAGHDPDSFIRSHDAAEFESLLRTSVPITTFLLDRLYEKWGSSVEGKGRLLNEIKPLVNTIADPARRSFFITEAAKKLDLHPEIAERSLRSTRSLQEISSQVNPLIESVNSYLDKTVMRIILLYPQYAEFFLNERGDGFSESEDLAGLFTHLEEALKKEGIADSTSLLGSIEDSALKGRLAAVILEAPANDAHETETMVHDALAAIRRKKLECEKKNLLMQIEKAEGQRQSEVVMELLGQKQELLTRTRRTKSTS